MTDAPSHASPDDDALAAARELLETVDRRPVDERPATLESVHGILAAELAALDEV